jgi:hypothetical protein
MHRRRQTDCRSLSRAPLGRLQRYRPVSWHCCVHQWPPNLHCGGRSRRTDSDPWSWTAHPTAHCSPAPCGHPSETPASSRGSVSAGRWRCTHPTPNPPRTPDTRSSHPAAASRQMDRVPVRQVGHRGWYTRIGGHRSCGPLPSETPCDASHDNGEDHDDEECGGYRLQ